MLKGDVSEVMLAVFAIIIGVLILTLLLPRVSGPVVQYYGKEQAITTANLVAGGINSMASVGEGVLIQDLGSEWEIDVYEEKGKMYLVASYFDERTQRGVTSTKDGKDVMVIGSVKALRSPVFGRKIRIIKEPGNPVEVRKL